MAAASTPPTRHNAPRGRPKKNCVWDRWANRWVKIVGDVEISVAPDPTTGSFGLRFVAGSNVIEAIEEGDYSQPALKVGDEVTVVDGAPLNGRGILLDGVSRLVVVLTVKRGQAPRCCHAAAAAAAAAATAAAAAAATIAAIAIATATAATTIAAASVVVAHRHADSHCSK